MLFWHSNVDNGLQLAWNTCTYNHTSSPWLKSCVFAANCLVLKQHWLKSCPGVLSAVGPLCLWLMCSFWERQRKGNLLSIWNSRFLLCSPIFQMNLLAFAFPSGCERGEKQVFLYVIYQPSRCTTNVINKVMSIFKLQSIYIVNWIINSCSCINVLYNVLQLHQLYLCPSICMEVWIPPIMSLLPFLLISSTPHVDPGY